MTDRLKSRLLWALEKDAVDISASHAETLLQAIIKGEFISIVGALAFMFDAVAVLRVVDEVTACDRETLRVLPGVEA